MDIFKAGHPFFLFILNLLLFIFWITVFIFGIFISVKLSTEIFDKIKYRKLKDLIKKNPHIGRGDCDGHFIYKQGRFTFKYRIIYHEADQTAKKEIEFISLKTKLWPYEERFVKFKKGISNFLIYHEWLYFFKSPVFLLLLLPILIFYFALVEPQFYKNCRLKWIISRTVGVNPENVEIKPGGWVKIGGTRRTVVDHQHESISYKVQPFKWLTFQDEGYITRYRGKPYGYIDHDLRYDDRGNIWLEKEGKWRYGKIPKDVVNWEEPQGTGIRTGKVLRHDFYLKDKFSTDDE